MKTRMSRKERQEQIVDTAMKLFVDHGYKGTTTAEIAEAAGISEVTLFRNFASKKDIFLQGTIPVLTKTLEESLSSNEEETTAEALERFFYDRLSVISENYGILRLVLMENQMNHDLSDIDFINTIGKMIRKELSRMGLNQDHADFTMRIMMGSILSFLYLPEKNQETVKKFVAALVRTVNIMNEKHGA